MIFIGWATVDQVDFPGAAVEIRGEIVEIDAACLPREAGEGDHVLLLPLRPGCHPFLGRQSPGEQRPGRASGEES